MKNLIGLGALLGLLTFAADGFAMVAQPTRLVMWRRVETIGGEEFVAANEAIVDYLGTLTRPTEPGKGLRYDCLAKTRTIQPSVYVFGGSNPNPGQGSVFVTMVYELHDCTPVP